jgi:hypothetical protein
MLGYDVFLKYDGCSLISPSCILNFPIRRILVSLRISKNADSFSSVKALKSPVIADFYYMGRAEAFLSIWLNLSSPFFEYS